MTQLMHYDAARLALAEAVKFDDVLAIKDVAKHAELYARQARDTELIERATEIKVRAERRAGQMLAAAKESGDRRGKGNPQLSNAGTFGLSDIGITKNESSRWQKLASVPDEQFEQAVAAAKEVAGEVTTAAMLRIERANNPPKIPTPETKKEIIAAVSDLVSEEPEDDQKNIWIESLNQQQEKITALEDKLSIVSMTEDQSIVSDTISSLRSEIKALNLSIETLTHSRDTYQNKAAELQKTVLRQNKEIENLHQKLDGKNG
jgi:hypothetical protein